MSAQHIVILYGSETGNVQDFANILSHKLNRWQFPHSLVNIADFETKMIFNCRYMFMLCSTTGQGELPRNALVNSDGKKRSFWSSLKKRSLPKDLLAHLDIAYFGLGDSSYPKFNYAIRKLHNRITGQLGANELFDRLEADEQGLLGSNANTGLGVEAVYFEYEKKILNFLRSVYPTVRDQNGCVKPREAIPRDTYLQPQTFLDISKEMHDVSDVMNKIHFENDESVRNGLVLENHRITSIDHFQDVRKLVFQGVEPMFYNAGDAATIYPFNSDDSVQKCLESQPGWTAIADEPLKFTSGLPTGLKDGGVVNPLTLRNILKYHCDITGIPKPSFFMKVWQFATNSQRLERGLEQLEQQREKLMQFGYDEDMQDLYDYCNRPRRSISEVLHDFQSLELPWQYIFDYMPLIKPRMYSISSAPNDSKIELTVAVVRYKTILKNIRKGLCSNYISRLSQGEVLRYKIIHNELTNKMKTDKPLIAVCPGVGIAPVMSFIKANTFSDITVIFGCRFKDKDFLYSDTLQKWVTEYKIKLFTCFSRDLENSPDAKYVQDVLWNYGEKFTELLVRNKGTFYLCGSSGKMPIQVRITVNEMLKKWGGFANEADANIYLKAMERENRYLQDTW